MLPGAEFNGRGPTAGWDNPGTSKPDKKELLIMSRMGIRECEEGRGGGWRLEVTRSRSVTVGGGEHTGFAGQGGEGCISRLFRAGTKESRMTNAKRARGQPDPRARAREQGESRHGDKRGCWKPWESPPPHKEPPAWKIILATPSPPPSDRPDSANYSFLREQQRGEAKLRAFVQRQHVSNG